MTIDRDFDRLARAWLALGPDELPERVLDSVADEIHHTRQRHGLTLPRRFPMMSLSARAAAILVVAALVGVAGLALVGGAGGRPAPSTPPSATNAVAPTAPPLSVPALTQFFVSPRHGYSVGHPAGWTEHGAQFSWLDGTSDWYGSAALDVLQGADARFVGASQPLLEKSSNEWLDDACRSSAPAALCTNVAANLPAIMSARISGYLLVDGDEAAGVPPSPNGRLYEAVFFFGSRAYDFRLDGNVDRDMFQAILDTIRFAPEDVAALPDLGGTFVSPTYGYSVKVAADWTATPASERWVGVGNDSPMMDVVDITGTDTSFTGASQGLGSRTYDDFLAAFHTNTLKEVPFGCDGGAPADWPEIWIGDRTGRLEVLCNAAEALVQVGDRVYVFDWGSSTFDTSQHFSLASWKDLLKTVTLDPGSATP